MANKISTMQKMEGGYFVMPVNGRYRCFSNHWGTGKGKSFQENKQTNKQKNKTKNNSKKLRP